ncbi:thioesterase family protein-like protein [Schizopora paradoxa]|uniref:Thioesterase family protein-like protein n=1 Tax=Schizopora paradoxa TaxID=27342 RepID=A0A0H2SNC4_9AGAM|nr:thioesterase family protein-like protein [Schizopora paradoxa]
MARHRSDYKYFLTYRTRWSDNDQYAHMNNAVYYHLMDSIINTYLEQHCGCSPNPSNSADSDKTPPAPPIGLVVSSQCTFLSPLSFPQVLVLGLRAKRLGRSSVTYEVGFFLEDDQQDAEASAFGGYTHVFVDRKSRKSVRDGISGKLERGLRAIYAPLQEDDEGTDSKPAKSKSRL